MMQFSLPPSLSYAHLTAAHIDAFRGDRRVLAGPLIRDGAGGPPEGPRSGTAQCTLCMYIVESMNLVKSMNQSQCIRKYIFQRLQAQHCSL